MEDPHKQTAWAQTLKAAFAFTQLGLTLVAPLVLCIALAWWLQDRFSLGDWVMPVGVLVGFSAMLLTLIRYLRALIRESKKRQEQLKGKVPASGKEGQAEKMNKE